MAGCGDVPSMGPLFDLGAGHQKEKPLDIPGTQPPLSDAVVNGILMMICNKVFDLTYILFFLFFTSPHLLVRPLSVCSPRRCSLSPINSSPSFTPFLSFSTCWRLQIFLSHCSFIHQFLLGAVIFFYIIIYGNELTRSLVSLDLQPLPLRAFVIN